MTSEIENLAAEGRLDQATPPVERLAAMAGELIRLAGSLSLEARRHQAGSEAGAAPLRTS